MALIIAINKLGQSHNASTISNLTIVTQHHIDRTLHVHLATINTI